MPRGLIFIIAMLLLAATPCCGVTVVYVDAAAVGPTYNGKTWATAYKTITAAISSNTGNDIYIKTGVYRECLTLNKYTNLYGGFLGRETSKDQRIIGAFPTVLDACEKGRAIDTQTTAFNIIDGLTIKRGVELFGGGIRCNTSAKVTIRNCRITDCAAGIRGGGVYFGKYTTGELTDCYIARCTAPEGGGVVVEFHSYPTLQRDVIVRNSAHSGGGVFCPFHSGAALMNCTIAYNKADAYGGAVYAYFGGPVMLSYCILTGNSAFEGGGVYVGGLSSQTTVTNCDLWDNDGGDWGGVIAEPDATAGNFSADPMLLAPDLDEFHLLPGSPCANVGAFPLENLYKIDRMGAATRLPDGQHVRFTGKVVGFVDGDVTYVEEPDRASAVQVRGLSSLARGDVLTELTGTLSTNIDGVREIIGTTATRWTCGTYALKPVGVRISSLATAPGLYARTWGRVADFTSDGFTLCDGEFHVNVRSTGPLPMIGGFVSVTGVFTHDLTFSAGSVAVH